MALVNLLDAQLSCDDLLDGRSLTMESGERIDLIGGDGLPFSLSVPLTVD